MTTGEIIINLTILAFVVITQLGTRVVDRRRFIVPLIMVAAVGPSYLGDAPPPGTTSRSTSPPPRPGPCSGWSLPPSSGSGRIRPGGSPRGPAPRSWPCGWSRSGAGWCSPGRPRRPRSARLRASSRGSS